MFRFALDRLCIVFMSNQKEITNFLKGSVLCVTVLYVAAVILMLLILPFLFLFVCGLFVSRKRLYDEDSRFYRWLLMSSTAIGLRLCRVRVELKGEELLPEGNFLLVSNHRSNFDPIVTWHALGKRRIAFVSKPENFRIPFFGPIIRRCCFLPIDRESPRRAVESVQRASSLLEKNDLSVGIYPEGTRSRNGELLPFHSGVLRIAYRAQKPLVAVHVSGTETIARRVPFRVSRVTLEVLSCRQPEEFLGKSTAVLSRELREEMMQAEKNMEKERKE